MIERNSAKKGGNGGLRGNLGLDTAGEQKSRVRTWPHQVIPMSPRSYGCGRPNSLRLTGQCTQTLATFPSTGRATPAPK
jgi:hypothetical protein